LILYSIFIYKNKVLCLEQFIYGPNFLKNENYFLKDLLLYHMGLLSKIICLRLLMFAKIRKFVGGKKKDIERNNEALETAAMAGQLREVEFLLQNSQLDSCGFSGALFWAAFNNHVPVVERLLQDPRVNPGDHVITIMRMIIKHNHLGLLERLLKDSRVNLTIENNWALRNAICSNKSVIVDRLLQDPRIMSSIKEDAKIVIVYNLDHFKMPKDSPAFINNCLFTLGCKSSKY
jgi:hypothetical protein